MHTFSICICIHTHESENAEKTEFACLLSLFTRIIHGGCWLWNLECGAGEEGWSWIPDSRVLGFGSRDGKMTRHCVWLGLSWGWGLDGWVRTYFDLERSLRVWGWGERANWVFQTLGIKFQLPLHFVDLKFWSLGDKQLFPVPDVEVLMSEEKHREDYESVMEIEISRCHISNFPGRLQGRRSKEIKLVLNLGRLRRNMVNLNVGCGFWNCRYVASSRSWM